MTEPDKHRERLSNGWVEAWRRDDGTWGVSWDPDEGIGNTYTPTGARPHGFPTEYDAQALLAWARQHWGQ